MSLSRESMALRCRRFSLGTWEAKPMTSGQAPDNRFSSARATLDIPSRGSFTYYRLDSLVDAGLADHARLERLPVTIKVLLENLLRNAGNGVVRDAEVEAMAHWNPAI